MEKVNKVEPKKTVRDFEQAYKKLCEEYGFRISVSPVFVPTNHGSFEISLQYQIGEVGQK